MSKTKRARSSRARRLALSLAVSLSFALPLLAACDDSDGGELPLADGSATPAEGGAIETPGPSGERPTSADRPSEGATCSPARSHEAGNTEGTLAFQGADRTYLLHVPPSYDGDEAVPLVLNLHGLGSSAREQAAYSGLPAKADAEGFVVVSPQGQGPIAYWNVARGAADVSFLGELLTALEEQLCIDPARVYSTGISNGALMSSRLACDLSDRIAAVAPVAGVSFPNACTPARPVPVVAFHGMADSIVPFEGGPIGIAALRSFIAQPVRESVAKWADHNGCAAAPREEQVSEHVTLVSHEQCTEGATVELYSVDGGGHTWPGAAVDVAALGATTREISATDLHWEFFAAHPKP